jgi:hypothetical protein
MRHIRGWTFDAVIGVGGIGAQAEQNGLKGKITWIDVGALKTGDAMKPLMTFDSFLHLGETGTSLRTVAPLLAKRMFDRNTRATTDAAFSPKEGREIESILEMVKDSGPSPVRLEPNHECTNRKKHERKDGCRTNACTLRRVPRRK